MVLSPRNSSQLAPDVWGPQETDPGCHFQPYKQLCVNKLFCKIASRGSRWCCPPGTAFSLPLMSADSRKLIQAVTFNRISNFLWMHFSVKHLPGGPDSAVNQELLPACPWCCWTGCVHWVVILRSRGIEKYCLRVINCPTCAATIHTASISISLSAKKVWKSLIDGHYRWPNFYENEHKPSSDHWWQHIQSTAL